MENQIEKREKKEMKEKEKQKRNRRKEESDRNTHLNILYKLLYLNKLLQNICCYHIFKNGKTNAV